MGARLGLGLAIVVGALAVVPAALAAYPTPYAAQGGGGLLSRDGSLRYVALNAGRNTLVAAIRTSDGATVRTRTLAGAYGIPTLTQNGLAGGLFRDGSTLVLQSMGRSARSSFVLVGTRDLAPRARISLKGTFGFDALSPDGSRLYLIQNSSVEDLEHYVVRAYDLAERTLRPGRIADKTQAGWVMQGFAVSRASSRDGRWVYTLYTNPGGYPFVHALDAVRGVAHCVGLPWRDANQGPVFDFRLAVKGNSLLVRRQDGRTYRAIDRKTWRVSR